MGGMRGVPDQEQVAVPPASRAQGGKPDPAAVVGEQRHSPQRVREHLCAEGDALLVAFAWSPRAFARVDLAAARPAALLELHYERAHRVAVRICVGLHDSDIRLGDEELESFEDQGRTQPHVARAPHIELRPEDRSPRSSSQAVDAVRADHQVM